MKKFLIIAGLVFISLSVSAQYKGQFRAIHAYEMAYDKPFFGLNFTGEYFPLNYFSIAPSFTFFVPPTGNARAFDLNARYYLTEKEKQWYLTAGYGFYRRIFEFNEQNTLDHNSLNLGVGGMIKFSDELGLNPEVRFQAFGRNSMVFKLGIVYFIN
ncbi:hypothetical protein Belba_2238 [Belliella baltica DSM 15883]|uniref:Outer membrane protein beta-barrel domain-containing protein n=1 Tax=Belliella baltica (strain DSM 15883 / CIP 108006 / LMG 21964 / BA134) TaxID=866536 RepID=I3Z6D6_BELBD|nr:hypothetical protein [Belliella baltica]AFL84804.1 hypothetical protein Belba_2238 [Belliella baltica DSM 15883]